MKIKYIFFDFDGVLAESVNIKTEAFRQMYLQYGKDFAQRVVDHHLDNGGISRFEKFKIYNGEWLNEKIDEKKIISLSAIFSNLVVEGVVDSPEVEGAMDFLNSAEDFKKYIITGTPTIEIKPILEKRKMDHSFAAIYGSPEKKEYWVNKILKDENASSKECVFIGDALADYKAAALNKVPFILRETVEAQGLFSDYSGYRIKDLKNLHQTIKLIEQNKTLV